MKCQGITSRRTPCKNRVLSGSKYCHIHQSSKGKGRASSGRSMYLSQSWGDQPSKSRSKKSPGKAELFTAAADDNLELVKELIINKGVYVNETDSQGTTPLMFAANEGSLKVANFLIRAGANINTKDNFGKTALDHVVEGDGDMINLLVGYGAKKGTPPMKGKILGSGAFGTVMLVERGGQQYALKEIKNVDEKEYKNIEREINSIKKLSWGDDCNPTIVCYKNIERVGSSVYITMEYIDGETLLDYLNRKGEISNNELIGMMKSMLRTLEYMHSKNVTHGDIKLNNIMRRKDGTIVFVDFGFACITDKRVSLELGRCTGNPRGTPRYFSPEIVIAYQNRLNLSMEKLEASDIWALGIVFFQLANGRSPFQSKTRKDLYANILFKDIISKNKNETINKIIEGMLIKRYDSRYHLNDIFRIFF